MRTPLNSVFMGLDLLDSELKKQNYDPHVTDLLNDVSISCHMVLDIMNELSTCDELGNMTVLSLDRTLINAVAFISGTVRPFFAQV